MEKSVVITEYEKGTRKLSIPKIMMWPLNTSTLHLVVLHRDKQKIANLISSTGTCNEVNINNIDKWGRSPIFYAVLGPLDVKIVQILLKYEALWNISDYKKRTIFHYAVQMGHIEIVNVLFQAVEKSKKRSTILCDKFQHDIAGVTPIHLASKLQSSQCLQLLFKNNLPFIYGSVNIVDNNELTPLHWASLYGNYDCVSALLANGADLSKVDKKGRTPLHYASLSNEQISNQCFNILLEACPSSANCRDALGFAPLHFVVQSQNLEKVRKLLYLKKQAIEIDITDNKGQTALHMASACGDFCIVEELLAAGANINKTDSIGATALHFATLNGHDHIVKLLVNTANMLELYTKDGQSALHWAAAVGSNACLLLLVHHNGLITKGDHRGRTSLHIAAQCNNSAILNILVRLGVSIDLLDFKRATPLHYAIQAGHTKIVKLLLNFGADLNAVDSFGKTAIHFSIIGGRLFLTQQLLGLNPGLLDCCDFLGCTPLHHSSYFGFTDAIFLLLRTHAHINARDYQGKTALHYACQKGHRKSVEALLGYNCSLNCMDSTLQRCTPLDYVDTSSDEGAAIASLLDKEGAVTGSFILNAGAVYIQSWWRGVSYRAKFRQHLKDNPIAISIETKEEIFTEINDRHLDLATSQEMRSERNSTKFLFENYLMETHLRKKGNDFSESTDESDDDPFDSLEDLESNIPHLPTKIVKNGDGSETTLIDCGDRLVELPSQQQQMELRDSWNQMLSTLTTTVVNGNFNRSNE